MSRYIDADALMEKYNVKDTNIAECLTDKKMARAFERFCIIADAVEEQPTVDAVQVVRCRECVHGLDSKRCGGAIFDDNVIWCTHIGEYFTKDHYCADGERRTE